MPEFKAPSSTALVAPAAKKARLEVVPAGPQRTSSLQAPIVLLSGHDSEVLTARFSPDGSSLASAGVDRQIFLWNVYGECENYSVLRGHVGAIMELEYSTDALNLVSCSTDKFLRFWDMATGACVRKLKGHTAFVNSCSLARRGPQLIVSGSDDGTVRVWDTRKKEAVHTFENTYQITAVTFNDTAEQIISGGIDNDIKVFDLRKESLLYKMRGHTDTVTGLRLSNDGSYVLSNSMDNTARIFDVRPFAPELRCIKIFQGHQHNFEKNLLRCCWSPDGRKISVGSADHFVYIFDTTTRKVLYKLPGHAGSVNASDFHPKENIVLSCSSDHKIYLGEISD